MGVEPIETRNVLVIRTDRMGDLILSTPLFQAIRTTSPEIALTVLAPPYALPVLYGNPFVTETIPWEGAGGRILRGLARKLKGRNFDAAILLNPGFRSGLVTLLAGISWRTGPLSRPSSFLFLNRGIRQKRSRSDRHQTELDTAFASLVTGGRMKMNGKGKEIVAPTLRVHEAEREEGARLLREAGVPRKGHLAGIHAGSGDSALRWPKERFAAVGRSLLREGWTVVFTGSAAERTLAARLASAIGEGAYSITGAYDLRSYFGLLSIFDLFVAPSTGPLHAAAALGVPVAAPFPPLPSQSPRRWGPRTERSAVLTPPVECPVRVRCIKSRCRHHPCMEKITAEDLFDAALELVSVKGDRRA